MPHCTHSSSAALSQALSARDLLQPHDRAGRSRRPAIAACRSASAAGKREVGTDHSPPAIGADSNDISTSCAGTDLDNILEEDVQEVAVARGKRRGHRVGKPGDRRDDAADVHAQTLQVFRVVRIEPVRRGFGRLAEPRALFPVADHVDPGKTRNTPCGGTTGDRTSPLRPGSAATPRSGTRVLRIDT